ncbi:NADP oxidoreductase [Mycobacterium heckeshornense]|uniref:ferredoxin--NADP(+) reductase n=1 Tax=Mycobacterium heckeshornense TaxID=110505 RepID=A0A2G8BGI8_9MYCO|nr:FAD-dependent oxidoreductase [Mycobacterium heckeshornense]KMV20091.1 NADP oxidoreductase [Mycobacterium heckeshornense]MCV7032644.1 FAD-dependent oxidoreductase [Mycobacterium heckeshornense]PIJ36865.1 NADP oxidoreductase [Mycobacterium heckeshornense]BCO35375.1 NADPH-ferredoxin reductase FprA [Mycobacterium heckeshornense]
MRPYHIAIVGSGPSGFFAAASLLKSADCSDGVDVVVDMLEMLPTPWGLVRSGVAPDHPKIKSISGQFEKIAEDPRCRFFGNVVVGEHVGSAELAERYDAVIYAVGAQADRALNIPGENLPGSMSAVDLVGWYNAHPHFQHCSPDLSAGRAVVVGNGNVALDVARILVTDPDVLAGTDIADHALASLRACGVQEVVILGRRGPLQTAFTTLELRELGELQGVDVVVDPAQLADINDEDAIAVGKTTKHNIKVLRDYAGRAPRPGHRRIVFRFYTSPIEITGTERVESIVLGRNELVSDERGRVVAKDTGAREKLAVRLVVRSVGYRGVPIPGLPFDEKTATIPNTNGRVVGSRNEYVVGWIKRGPSGVIGTNKKDSQDTVDTLLADLADAAPSGLAVFAADHADQIADWLASRQPKLVTATHWQAIDEHERTAGQPHGRPRIKLPTIDELLRIGHAYPCPANLVPSVNR